jgi:hypothetical protein
MDTFSYEKGLERRGEVFGDHCAFSDVETQCSALFHRNPGNDAPPLFCTEL